jgi:hypothetical protein
MVRIEQLNSIFFALRNVSKKIANTVTAKTSKGDPTIKTSDEMETVKNL